MLYIPLPTIMKTLLNVFFLNFTCVYGPKYYKYDFMYEGVLKGTYH